MQELIGGRRGELFRCENEVYRPLGDWSASVHRLLTFLAQNGFTGSPTFLRVENGCEVLSYLEGETYNYPLISNIASQQALVSAAKLLSNYHDITRQFISAGGLKDSHWMLPSRKPFEVICHGDFAPYNVVLNGQQTVAMFDFDTAHPAPRIWDIAYAVYCWAPFKVKPEDRLGNIHSQSVRAKLFCDSYGLDNQERQLLIGVMCKRLLHLVSYMRKQAEIGNQAFIENINDGHHLAYLADIEYINKNQKEIMNSLIVKVNDDFCRYPSEGS